jgi:YVTN family beta-propeller protein
LDFATDLTPPERRGNIGPTLPAMLRNAMASLALGTVLLGAAGCGDVFRPPVSGISPVGPAAQPTHYVIAVSDPGNGQPGLFNMIDFSGDTVLNTTAIGVSPQYQVLGLSGTELYNLNHDGSVNNLAVLSNVRSDNVQTSTLFAGADANSIFTTGTSSYFTEPYTNTAHAPSIAQAQGFPPSVKQELTVAANPIYIAGTTSSTRIYAISQGTTPGTSTGTVTAIQVSNNSIANTFAVGTNPVFGIMTADNNRAFVLNEGSNSVSVINVNTDQLDASPTANPIPVGGGPVWADLYSTGNLLVTANSTGNSVSIITIPLCSIVALPTNPTCDAANPTDAATFGTVLATVPVGTNPQMVTVLQDGTRAYVANFNATNVSGYSIVGDPATITAYSSSSNVATITANNNYVAGSLLTISGLTSAGAYLDGGPYTVLSTGLSPTQFQISLSHADVATTLDSGTAIEGTATVAAPNSYTSGQSVMLAGLRIGAGPSLNGGPYKVLPAGLSATQFEVEVPFGTTSATVDYGTTSVSGTYGSVSVVNLSTYTVSRTIVFDGLLNGNGSQNINHGPYCHPNFINSIAGTPTGKVYVTCPDGQQLTVIETDTDTVDTLIDLQGYAVQMRVTASQ